MRLTLGRATLLAVFFQWLVEWLGWTHPPTTTLGHWSVVAVRGVIYLALGALAVRHGLRWSAPLLPAGAALAASLAVCLVGIVTGEFLARGMGPALVLAFLISITAYSLIAGVVGAAAAFWISRPATGSPLPPVA